MLRMPHALAPPPRAFLAPKPLVKGVLGDSGGVWNYSFSSSFTPPVISDEISAGVSAGISAAKSGGFSVCWARLRPNVLREGWRGGLATPSVSDSASESEGGKYSACLVTTWMAALFSGWEGTFGERLDPTISLIFSRSNKYSTSFSGIRYFMVVDGCGP